MKKTATFLALVLIIFMARAQESSPRSILIQNVHIFNGIDNSLISGDVLINDHKIKEISNSISTKEAEKIIDGQGQYLIPGLIDAHTHITFEDIEMPLSRLSSEIDWATLNIIATQAAKKRLLRGFTTLRDMGGNAIPLSKAIDKGIIPGPRIYPSGAFISQSGGHGDFGLPTDVPRTPDQLSYSERIGFTAIADGADEVLKRVREQLRQGATQIKMMAGGGVTSDYDPLDASQYTVEEFKAAVSATDNFDTYVAVHAYTPTAIQTAIKGGVKAIEHGHLMDEETAKLMAEKGIWLDIQPWVASKEFLEADPDTLDFTNQKRQKMLRGTDNAYTLAKKYKLKTAWSTDMFGGAEKAKGVNSLLVALKRWYSPYEILTMVTSNNAEFLRLSGNRNPYKEAKIGEISEGAWADLILVNGNPLKNIDLLANPEDNFLLIIKNGVIYKDKISNN